MARPPGTKRLPPSLGSCLFCLACLVGLLAVVTLSRCKLQEGAGRWLKLVSGAVMAGLGLALIFEPGWLAW